MTQSAAGVRQQHRTRIEQAVGVMHLDGLAPVVAVEPAGEGQPVRAGMGAVAAAELLAIGQPQPALAVESEPRIGVARGRLELRWPRRSPAERRACRRARSAIRRPVVSACRRVQADDADGAIAVERIAAVGRGRRNPCPISPDLPRRRSTAALGVVADGGTGLETGRAGDELAFVRSALLGVSRSIARRSRRHVSVMATTSSFAGPETMLDPSCVPQECRRCDLITR